MLTDIALHVSLVAVLAIVVGVACRWGRFRPAICHALWLVVLFKLLLPPVIAWPVSLQSPPPPPKVQPAVTQTVTVVREVPAPAWDMPKVVPVPRVVASPAPPPVHKAPSPFTWRNASILLAIVWGIGSLLTLALHLHRIRRFRSLVKQARPAPDWLRQWTDELAATFGVRAPVVMVAPGIASAVVWNPWRPRIFVSADLLDSVGRDGWKGILAHELAHLKRRDLWVGWLELAASCLWWWNPLLAPVRRRLHLYTELACDAWVLWALPESGSHYAEVLYRIVSCETGRQESVPAFGMAAGPAAAFKTRLSLLLQGGVACRMPGRALAAIIALLLVALPSLSTAAKAPPRARVLLALDNTAVPAPSAPPRATAPVTIEKVLDAPGSIEFDNIHLMEILSFIADSNEPLNFCIDWRVVQIPGNMDTDANSHARGRKPVYVTDGMVPHADIRNVAWREVLDRLLRPMGLTYVVKAHHVWISSPAMIQEDSGRANQEPRNPSPELTKALGADCGIAFQDIHVRDFLEYFSKSQDIPIVIDDTAVAPAPGKSGAPAVTGDTSRCVTNGFVACVELKNTPALEVLEAVLRPLDLIAVVEDKYVRVTSYDRASGDRAETATPAASSAPPPGEVSDSAVEAEELFVLDDKPFLAHIRIRGVESWVCPGVRPRGGYGLKEFTMDPPGVLLVRQADGGTVRVPARQGAVRVELSAASDTNGPILLRIEGADNRLSATIQPALREEKPVSCRIGDMFGFGGYIVTEIDAKAGTILLTDCNAKVAFRLTLSGVVPRPEMPADLRARLTKQKMTCTMDTVDSLLSTLSLASGLSIVVQDTPSFSPVSVTDMHPLQLMEKVAEQSGGSFCFIVRPYGILVTSVDKARTISGASIPPNVPCVTTPRAGDYSKRPRLFPEAMESALGRQPLTLSGRGAEIRLSSLVEMLSIASELTFAMEKEVLLKPYDFTNLWPPDIMAAISEMTQDQVCFVFRDYGILVTSRDTALRRSGASIPDLPLEQLEETPPPRSPLPQDVKKLLTKDDPLIFNFRPEDVQSGGGSELAKLFSLASGLQLKIDTKVSEESQAEGRPEYPRPYCFMINGNCLQLMQAVVEASNGVLSFVLAAPSGFTLTDFGRARALPGPGIQEVPLRPVTSEKQLTPPDSPPSPEATPATTMEQAQITPPIYAQEPIAEYPNAEGAGLPGASKPAGEELRTLHFPADRPVGTLLDLDKLAVKLKDALWWQCLYGDAWETIATAQGDVNIPGNTRLGLVVAPDAFKDLSFLGELPGDSVELLAFSSDGPDAPSDVKGMTHIAHLTGLKALYVENLTVPKEDLPLLKALSMLETLVVSPKPFDATAAASIAEIHSLKRVRIGFSDRLITGDVLFHLAKLTSLEELVIGARSLESDGLKHLAQPPSLRMLRINAGDFAGEGLAHLAAFPVLQRLEFYDLTDQGMSQLPIIPPLKKLDVQGKHDGFRPESFGNMARMAGLEALVITGRYSDDCIAQLKPMTSLKSLSLRPLMQDKAAITDAALAYIGTMVAIEKLDISTGDFTDGGLAALTNLPTLRRLNIPNAEFTDAALVHIGKMAHLEELCLRATNITDEGLTHLESLAALKGLGFIFGKKITDEGIARLRGKLPSLKEVIFVPPRGAQVTQHAETQTPVAAADAEAAYREAQKSYVHQDYKAALEQFSKYLEQHPGAEQAGDAQFWKAKCQLSLDRYAEAATEFEKILLDYPTSAKAPFAMHEEGLCRVRQGQTQRAIELFRQTVRDYPSTPAADQAKQDLKRLQQPV